MKVLSFVLLATLSSTPLAAETAIAPEVNPPGDIPDNQVFVTFVSADGYSIKIPEGWAKAASGSTTTFSDKYNHIAITTVASSTPPDQKAIIQDLEANGRAVAEVSVKTFAVGGSAATMISYSSNSEPNAVTNKQVREENEKLIYSKAGKRVELTLSAPKGADNADQWNLISKSFKWK